MTLMFQQLAKTTQATNRTEKFLLNTSQQLEHVDRELVKLDNGQQTLRSRMSNHLTSFNVLCQNISENFMVTNNKIATLHNEVDWKWSTCSMIFWGSLACFIVYQVMKPTTKVTSALEPTKVTNPPELSKVISALKIIQVEPKHLFWQ